MNLYQALEILGISSDYTEESLKKKYRQLISRNHPDKFSGCDSSTLKIQEIITTNINLANELLQSKLLESSDASSGVDDTTGNNQGFLFSRKRVHPNHKDGSFQRLWHKILSIRGQKDYSLVMELYNLSIIYLLQDFKKYPDIDGILHNYIRDYASILVGIGKYHDAFTLIKLSIVNNFRSYYDFNHPSSLLFTSIIKTRYQLDAIESWEKLLVGDILITHIPTQWAIIYTYYINHSHIKIFECIENGFLAINFDNCSLTDKTQNSDIMIIGEQKNIAKQHKDPVVLEAYLEEQRKKAEQERIYKGKLIRILIVAKEGFSKDCFSQKYPKTAEVIDAHFESNIRNPEFAIDEKIKGFAGFHGTDSTISPIRECKEEALEIFQSFVKKPASQKTPQKPIKQKSKKMVKKQGGRKN